MKNVIAIIKNAWGDSPPPKVKTGFIPNPCDWEKKNYLTNPGSYYRQKASVGFIAMKGWLFTILRLPNCTFANQAFSYFPFLFSILNNQILAIYKLYNHFWNDMKVSYPVKVAVKKTAFIALFSGMVLSAGAQNTNLITEEEPDIKVTKDTVWNMAIEKKATPKVQFPQPGDTIDVLDPIVYSLCYTTAYDRLARKSVKVKTYRKEYAPYIHAGYDFGVKHWKEIVLKNFSSLRKQLQGIAESTGMERVCFRTGALMGAYSTNPYPELDYIDAAISDVLKQVRKHITSENEMSRHYDTLSDKWFSFLCKEKERYYDIANHNRPYFLCQEHADDALILPEWIDSATASNDITQSEALASAIAKFDSPAAPDGIRKLKDNMRLTPDERNALLAPNDMISYAVGVAQANWIMEYKWFIGETHRKEFDAMLLSMGNRPAIISAFEDGLRSAMTITGCFKNAILRQDCDSICLMNKAIKAELNKAYRQDVVYGYAFMNGMDAVEIYRAGAEWDIPEKQTASGLRLDKDQVLEGFRDYLEGHLKMGVEYARTLTKGRNAIDWHLYEKDTETIDLSENGFQPAIPLHITTGTSSEWSAELSQMITLPQEVVGQNITGKVMATVVIEADGAVSKVEITSSPHPALSETVTDCIYRMRFMPAKYDGECVASVAVIPVLF